MKASSRLSLIFLFIFDLFNLQLRCTPCHVFFHTFVTDTRVVGPLLTSPSKPLPSKLEEFMQSSGDDGVIVVAFGTTLGTLDKEILAVMARAFAEFPQKFIWKLNEGNHCGEGVVSNSMENQWARERLKTR